MARGKNPRAQRPGAYYRAARYPAALREAPAHTLDFAGYVRVLAPLPVAYVPELKRTPLPPGLDRDDLRRAFVDAFRAQGIAPERVFLQSFDLEDLAFWRRYAPAYARRGIWLDGRRLDPEDPATWHPGMAELKAGGLAYLGPPIRYLIKRERARLVPTAYARAARAAGLLLVPWTLEREADLGPPEALYRALAALGVFAVFSDDPGRYSERKNPASR